jgi:uncharacterized membrane protein YedE/YeeE
MSYAAATPQVLAAGQPARLPRWASLGIAFGVLGALSIIAWGPIGVSGTYPRIIGEVARVVAPAWASANPYLVKMGSIMVPETFILLGLVIGGMLIVFGARLAGGCTSGHIIFGITQLSVSGFIFAAGVFATGIGTAKLLNAARTGGR